eukprot:1151191-Pelagomonas_calceolata.AAC.3
MEAVEAFETALSINPGLTSIRYVPLLASGYQTIFNHMGHSFQPCATAGGGLDRGLGVCKRQVQNVIRHGQPTISSIGGYLNGWANKQATTRYRNCCVQDC